MVLFSAADLQHEEASQNQNHHGSLQFQHHRCSMNMHSIHIAGPATSMTCQGEVEGFTGDTVLLPCIYKKVDLLPDLVSIYWRDQNDWIVLDIIKNVPDNSTQNQKFRGRVSSFPELYKNGNFSITMKNVQQSDSGPYECHIPKVDFQLQISLNVSDKRVEAVTPPPAPSDGAAVTPNMVLLLLPLSLLLSSFH